MNRSAKDGKWSSLHYGGEGVMVPSHCTKVCADDTVRKTYVLPREDSQSFQNGIGISDPISDKRKGKPCSMSSRTDE